MRDLMSTTVARPGSLDRTPLPGPLTVKSVSMRFGDVVACDDVSFAIAPGEIVGLLGENGAGKSTLLGVIEGQLRQDRGTVVVNGIELVHHRVFESQAAGAMLVRQHPELVPVFTVAEQLALAGVDPSTVQSFVADLDPLRLIADLTPGERQLVEVARSVGRSPGLLLLDEPTSNLGEVHRDAVHATMRMTALAGGGCLLVTHRLDEALEVCDRILVMRRGRIVDRIARTRSRGSWPDDVRRALLGAMFGEAGSDLGPKEVGAIGRRGEPRREPSRAVVVARGITDDEGASRHAPREIDFDLHPGEILAIAGIEGQGQRELGLALAGFRRARGTLLIDGRELGGGGSTAFRDAGVAYLPGDRRGQGSVAAMSVAENLFLSRQRSPAWRRRGRLDWRSVARDAAERIRTWNIQPPDPLRPVGLLSGGNLQKVLLARALADRPRLLIADTPTHGLDAPTQDVVWAAIGELTAAGGAAIVITPDLDEALGRADRVAIMRAGRLSVPRPARTVDRAALARLMVTDG